MYMTEMHIAKIFNDKTVGVIVRGFCKDSAQWGIDFSCVNNSEINKINNRQTKAKIYNNIRISCYVNCVTVTIFTYYKYHMDSVK